MEEINLVDMLWDREPIKKFEELLKAQIPDLEWGHLLHICYCEESYLSVGGDEGYLDNPPIDYEGLAYIEKLIALLEENGITEEE